MRLLRVALMGVCCLGSITAFAMSQAPSTMANETLIGQPAPDSSLPNPDGTTSSVMAARQGNKAILVFWATWCPHCREELESIRQHLGTLEQEGIKLILVSVGEAREEAAAYLEHQRIGLTSFIDEENALQEPYGLEGVPTVVFINAQGNILDIDHAITSDYLSIFNQK